MLDNRCVNVACFFGEFRYACSSSGHIFEVDYLKVAVRHVRRLHAVNDTVRSTHSVDEKQHAVAGNGRFENSYCDFSNYFLLGNCHYVGFYLNVVFFNSFVLGIAVVSFISSLYSQYF